MEKEFKWSEIPKSAKILIKRQYQDYLEIAKGQDFKPDSWKVWAKRQGYIVND